MAARCSGSAHDVLGTGMHTWPTRVGAVLQMLDPASGPRLVLDRLWLEVQSWKTIGGLWLHCRPGHLAPAGIVVVGEAPPEVEEIAAMAGPNTAPIATDGLPVVARQLRDGNVPIATIVVSHHGSEDAAAFIVDVLSRWCTDRLRLQLEASELVEENQALRGALAVEARNHEIVTNSGTMRALIQTAARAAASTATVLIQGETGTGKELFAKLIHANSQRAHKPLVAVNAGALAPGLLESELFGHARGAFTGADRERKGLFEVANGGTLFLDEVGELGPEAQVRLLRALQERTITRVGDHAPVAVDVRVIAATHRDLAEEVRAGRFRQDLFYRLNVVGIQVPSLRARREDVPLLVNHFLQKHNRANYKAVEEVPRRVLEMLIEYPWPGNVRELENCVQKAVVLAPGAVFLEELVPPTVRSWGESHGAAALPDPEPDVALATAITRWADTGGPDIAKLVHRAERVLIEHALNRARGVKLRAAKALGINRVTLDRKLVEHRIAVRRGQGVVADGTGDAEESSDEEDGPRLMETDGVGSAERR
jgi:two-component system response regulator HydG